MRALADFLPLWSASAPPDALHAGLVRLFRDTPEPDFPITLALLQGHPPPRRVSLPELSRRLLSSSPWPEWLRDRCKDEVGSVPEFLARIQPEPGPGLDLSLRELNEVLTGESEWQPLWDQADIPQRILLGRLLTARFPKPLSRTLLAETLAAHWDRDPSGLELQLAATPCPGDREVEEWKSSSLSVSLPPCPESVELNSVADLPAPPDHWQAEWLWPGVPAQLVRRDGISRLWAAGQLVSDRVPQILRETEELLDGTVLTGHLLNPPDSPPLTGDGLDRQNLDSAVFLARDCVEIQGVDIQTMPLYARRDQLLPMVGNRDHPCFRVSESLFPANAAEAKTLLARCGDRAAAGLWFRSLHGSATDPVYWIPAARTEIDLQLMYVLSSGEPVYTFGREENGEWVPLARFEIPEDAEESRPLESYCRQHTVEKKGPVRVVRPGFHARISYQRRVPSPRHKSGVVLIDPRLEFVGSGEGSILFVPEANLH